jgi:hypothetical protein
MKLSLLVALIASLLAPVMHAADEAKPGVSVILVATRPSHTPTEEVAHLKPVISECRSGVVAFIKEGGQVHLSDRLVFQPKIGPCSVGLKLELKF